MDTQLDIFTASQRIPDSAPGLQKEYDMQPILDNLKPIADLCDQYFNTTRLTGRVLKERQFRAGSQGVAVYTHFKIRPDRSFTPSEVWQSLRLIKRISKKVPLTSIRRAMSSLTKREKLIKLDGKDGREKVQRVGIYGDLEFAWIFNNRPE